MGINEPAVTAIRKALDDEQRTYAWLAREAHLPYKRILSEIKHATRPLSFETAVASFAALGIDFRGFVVQAVAA